MAIFRILLAAGRLILKIENFTGDGVPRVNSRHHAKFIDNQNMTNFLII